MADDHLIPNTTQVPNSILDLLMPFLHDGEARVLLYLCRRTYGFQRESDSVSLEQFVSGIRTEGRQLDFGAGISRQGAMNALAVLKGIGIVEQLEGGRGRGNIPVFRINRKCEMVKLLDLIAQDPDNPREKIAQNLDLIRQKSLPYGPFHKKAKNDKPSRKKVEILDLSEKVETTPQKGLTVRPTKPSITKPRKEKDTPPIPPPRAAHPSRGYEGFQAFWDAYPKHRHVKKAACVIIWHRLKPDDTLQATILGALAQQRESPDWKKQAGEFVPHPSAWLNQRRWEDEVSTTKGFDPEGYFARESARLEREEAAEKERRRHATERT